MRAIIQRVLEASVSIEGSKKAEIGEGLLVLLGIEEQDSEEDIRWLSAKIAKLRIMNDENGVMNRSLLDTGGDVIVVSQFTLHASTRKGNRPSYIGAAAPTVAIPLYERFLAQMEQNLGKEIGAGEFGADMKVALFNDGPVTIFIDSKRRE